MAWITEAHTQWHMVFPDTPWGCPLDCGAGDDYDYEPDDVPVPEEPPMFEVIGWGTVQF